MLIFTCSGIGDDKLSDMWNGCIICTVSKIRLILCNYEYIVHLEIFTPQLFHTNGLFVK